MMKLLQALALIIVLVSCKKELIPEKQATVLDDNSGFNLEKVNFNEDVPQLFSKHFINDFGYDMEGEYNAKGKDADSIFRYKIDDGILRELDKKLPLPMKDFGFHYRTPEIDSVARYQNIYFRNLSILTDLKKKPVAYFASAELSDWKVRKQFIDDFTKAHGAPKHAYAVSHEFKQNSYEWDLGDRTVQIGTFNGFGFTASSDGTNKSSTTYNMDILIIDNKAKVAIDDAHIRVLPDVLTIEGKSHSLKELQIPKESKSSDAFLLNSAQDRIKSDSIGEFDISRAEPDGQ